MHARTLPACSKFAVQPSRSTWPADRTDASVNPSFTDHVGADGTAPPKLRLRRRQTERRDDLALFVLHNSIRDSIQHSRVISPRRFTPETAVMHHPCQEQPFRAVEE
ncbi:hypothetical protein EVAR_94678_1 [Eumeta japonica]|uniref:Uncharacterized protein n=1 Tax=Eumeta variegata TaxID=151549 RepID=A0A4C1UVN5_EUMVA|nr:hypothetical protein EVAR_94678_1 [Eumeta japonica]